MCMTKDFMLKDVNVLLFCLECLYLMKKERACAHISYDHTETNHNRA